MSKIKEPTQKRALITREKLISAAKKVFNEKGYHNTFIKDITSEAGMSVGLFYKYFKDKDEIYEEAVHTLLKEEIEIVINFKEEMFKNDDKKSVIRLYIESRIETIKYMRTRKEVELISQQNEKIRKNVEEEKSRYFFEIKEVLMDIWGKNADENRLQIGIMLLWNTLYMNIIEIYNIQDETKKILYIDSLTNMIFHFLNEI